MFRECQLWVPEDIRCSLKSRMQNATSDIAVIFLVISWHHRFHNRTAHITHNDKHFPPTPRDPHANYQNWLVCVQRSVIWNHSTRHYSPGMPQRVSRHVCIVNSPRWAQVLQYSKQGNVWEYNSPKTTYVIALFPRTRHDFMVLRKWGTTVVRVATRIACTICICTSLCITILITSATLHTCNAVCMCACCKWYGNVPRPEGIAIRRALRERFHKQLLRVSHVCDK